MSGRRDKRSHRARAVAPVTAAALPPAATLPARSVWLALALVLIGTVVLYWPALKTGFFADDFLFLDQVRSRSLLESLRAPDPLSNFFRPVSRQLYFWIVAGLTHESPVAFRVGNLATLLGVVTLLFALVRRMAGSRAGIFAAAFLALHYAADIPVRWACGSQELLAVTGALAALLLHLSGRRNWAGVAMLFAALSKEVILLMPLIAVVADHRSGESWRATARRALPLAVAVVVWGAISLAMPHTRQAQATEVEFDLVRSPLAALAHLLQVIPGLEWLPGHFGTIPHSAPPLLPVALAVAALAVTWRARSTEAVPATSAERAAAAISTRRTLLTGCVWVAVATAPVIAVALLWSAYYYLFAICGVALLAGVLLARAPVAVAAIVLALAAWGSANARALPDFGQGRDAWTPLSHINASYLDRSNQITDSYLASLKRAYPKLPQGSTVYFGGLKSNVAFQRGNGPLLRWAYRDTSLRAYYMNMFSKETARPGPLLFFLGSGDTLREMEHGDDLFLRVAFGMIISEQAKGASDALEVAATRQPNDARVGYWQAWTHYAAGDTARAYAWFASHGYAMSRGPAATRDAATTRLAAGDSATALALARQGVREHVLDGASHGLLADLMLIAQRRNPDAAIEAFAARELAPRDAYAWRRWAMVQMDRERPLEALKSFGMYFQMGGKAAADDAEAHGLEHMLRASIPRGVVDPESLPD